VHTECVFVLRKLPSELEGFNVPLDTYKSFQRRVFPDNHFHW